MNHRREIIKGNFTVGLLKPEPCDYNENTKLEWFLYFSVFKKQFDLFRRAIIDNSHKLFKHFFGKFLNSKTKGNYWEESVGWVQQFVTLQSDRLMNKKRATEKGTPPCKGVAAISLLFSNSFRIKFNGTKSEMWTL